MRSTIRQYSALPSCRRRRTCSGLLLCARSSNGTLPLCDKVPGGGSGVPDPPFVLCPPLSAPGTILSFPDVRTMSVVESTPEVKYSLRVFRIISNQLVAALRSERPCNYRAANRRYEPALPHGFGQRRE